MDSITHTLAGIAIARVGGDRKTPLAAATLILASNAPDIDIFSVWLGSFGSLAFRRGLTHGPIALPLLTLSVTALILLWDRFVRRRRDPSLTAVDPKWTLLLAAIGCLSHPMLDWLNTYGVRFLMPFSGRWSYGDALFIIDPYWWLLLIAILVLARRGASLRAVRTLGVLALVYPFVLIGLSQLGVRAARRAAEGKGLTPAHEILYQPRPLNPLAAQLIVVTDSAYLFGNLQWGRTPRVRLDGVVVPRGDWTDPRVTTAMEDPDVKDYLVWSRFPYVEIVTNAAGNSVRFGDARFLPGRIPAEGLAGLRVPIAR